MVKIRPYRRGGWEVDITVRLPSGSRWRERSKAPGSSRSAAIRWGQDRERHVLQHGVPQPKKEAPTLEQFAPRCLDGYARANRQKPSGIAAKEMIIRVHLTPVLGARRLDSITNEEVQRLKHRLLRKAAKTVNNILTVLNVLLKQAVEWGVIERMPCSIKLLPVAKGSTRFYDFDEFERLVTAAETTDPRAYLLVLLSGDAGLRLGEMVALEWNDIDFVKRQMCVQRSAWKGQVASPKSGRLRYIPLTSRLTAALRDHRHLRGPRVLYQDDGSPLTEGVVQGVRPTSGAESGPLQQRTAHAPSHVLFASGDARRAGTGDSGVGRPSGFDDDAAVHAPQSCCARQRDSVAGVAWKAPLPWRHTGDGIGRAGEVECVEQVNWRRERDSNPR